MASKHVVEARTRELLKKAFTKANEDVCLLVNQRIEEVHSSPEATYTLSRVFAAAILLRVAEDVAESNALLKQAKEVAKKNG